MNKHMWPLQTLLWWDSIPTSKHQFRAENYVPQPCDAIRKRSIWSIYRSFRRTIVLRPHCAVRYEVEYSWSPWLNSCHNIKAWVSQLIEKQDNAYWMEMWQGTMNRLWIGSLRSSESIGCFLWFCMGDQRERGTADSSDPKMSTAAPFEQVRRRVFGRKQSIVDHP